MTDAGSPLTAELLARLGGARIGGLVGRPRSGPAPALYERRTLGFLDRLTPGDASYRIGVLFTLTECLAYLAEVWTDLRPLSLRDGDPAEERT